LYPESKKKEILELEEYIDQELGVNIRRYVYSSILHLTELAIESLLLPETTPFERKVLPKMFNGLKSALAKVYSTTFLSLDNGTHRRNSKAN
jgi:hypothetical protein